MCQGLRSVAIVAKVAIEKRNNILNTKTTIRIKSSIWKTRATLYNIWSVEPGVKQDTKKKDTNPRK